MVPTIGLQSAFASRPSAFRKLPSLLASTILVAVLVTSAESRRFEFFNNCPYTVWPGVQANANLPQLNPTGFELKPNQRRTLDAPDNWGGRMWGRTGCSQQAAGFRCESGDCGGFTCDGRGGATPATLAEITLSGHGGKDFYDVSLVDGFNMPLGMTPRGGCPVTSCPTDVNAKCPNELVVTAGNRRVGCKSACLRWGDPKYCCTGAYSTPDKCKPTYFSKIFSDACPKAYSYAYDDLRGTFTCAGGDYLITYCPSAGLAEPHKGVHQLQYNLVLNYTRRWTKELDRF